MDYRGFLGVLNNRISGSCTPYYYRVADIEHAFDFIVENGGMDTDDDYPHTGKDERCYGFTVLIINVIFLNYLKERLFGLMAMNGFRLTMNNRYKQLLQTSLFLFLLVLVTLIIWLYLQGIFIGKCGTDLDYDVVEVGYGTQADKDYLLVRNSWGADWGEHGYARIEHNVIEKTGKCGTAMEALYPVRNGQIVIRWM
ncbi:putative zingipain [Helianthus annuus]|nr:putative zingipain [Helianthus annuus]KAJ0756678.1 putative zingipain [Helianthus annuus]KAJ0760427.1 putative zingipain [Helianthus annuus]